MFALLVGKRDGWMVALLVRAGRLDGGAAGESWQTGWWRYWLGELDGWMVALLGGKRNGWMVALLVKRELNGWMFALLVGRELDD